MADTDPKAKESGSTPTLVEVLLGDSKIMEFVRNVIIFARSTKEKLDSLCGFNNPMDAAVTWRNLANVGLVDQDGAGRKRWLGGVVRIGDSTIGPPGGVSDLTPPPAPTGFSASAALQNTILTWTAASYSNHDYTEVWRNTSNSLTGATKLGVSRSAVFVDAVGISSAVRYYWIRHVSTSGVIGDYNSATGTANTTAQITEADITPLTITDALIANSANIDGAKIASLTAGKITAGTITSGSIYLGSTEFLLDGSTKRMTITGGGSQAVELGSLSYDTSKYGLHIKNSGGTTVFKADQSVVEVDGSILKVSTASWRAMMSPQPMDVRVSTFTTATNVEDGASVDFTPTFGLGSDYVPPSDTGYTIKTDDSILVTLGTSPDASVFYYYATITVHNTSATAPKAGYVDLGATFSVSPTGSGSTPIRFYFRLREGTSLQTFNMGLIGTVVTYNTGRFKPKLTVVNTTGASDGLIVVDDIRVTPKYILLYN